MPADEDARMSENLSYDEFRRLTLDGLAFLGEHGFRYAGSTIVNRSAPMDRACVVRYSYEIVRIDVSLTPVEHSLSMLLKYKNVRASTDLTYAYFEPLVKFLEPENYCVVVPFLKPRATSAEIVKTMKERERVMEQGVRSVAMRLFGALHDRLSCVLDLGEDRLAHYQAWYRS